MSRTLTAGIDYTSRDYQAYKQDMIKFLQAKIPEYTDTSETDAGIVIIESLANGLDVCSMYADVVANDMNLSTTQDRRIAISKAKVLGYIPFNQTASRFKQVFVLAEVMPTNYIIGKGTTIKTLETEDAESIYFETLADLEIPAGALGNEKDAQGNYLYSVLVEQGETVGEDIIGSSRGTPFQTFPLEYLEVLTNTIQLYVDEGFGQVLWKQVPSLLEYDNTDKVYTVSVDEFDTCYIEFGNGLNGKIPSILDNGIVASYRTGGGEVGNVNPETITEFETGLSDVDRTFNPDFAVVLGHEKESLEEIKINAPASLRVMNRIVNIDDYGDFIRINFYEIKNANALRDATNILKANVYYQLRKGYTMTPELRTSITKLVESRIISGTSFSFNPFVPFVVNMTATLIVDANYYNADVKLEVETFLKDVLFEENRLSFKDEVAKSEIESQVVMSVVGAKSFRITAPTTDIIRADTDDKIITLGTVAITVSGGKDK